MKDNLNKRFWEKVAKVYAPFQEKGNKDSYETLCQKIEALFRKEQKVLELAYKALMENRRVLKEDGILIAPIFVYDKK